VSYKTNVACCCCIALGDRASPELDCVFQKMKDLTMLCSMSRSEHNHIFHFLEHMAQLRTRSISVVQYNNSMLQWATAQNACADLWDRTAVWG